MRRRWVLVSILALLTVSAAKPVTSPYVMPADRKPGTPGYVLPWNREPTSWGADLAAQGEPGPRFRMSGVLHDSAGAPLAGAKLYIYHADGQGNYWRKGDEPNVNRIGGVVRTNGDGEYLVRSILPGQYEGPPHVHVELWGKDRIQYVTPVSLHPALDTPVSGWKDVTPLRAAVPPYVAIVTLDSSGVYVCNHDLYVSKMTPAAASHDSLLRELSRRLERKK